MSAEFGFTNVGEFRRGKGTKKSRLGPPMRVGNTGGERKTPNGLALYNLRKILKEQKRMNNRQIYHYNFLLEQVDNVRYMNMKVLAEVIVFLNSNTIDFFSQDPLLRPSYEKIAPYLDRVLDQLDKRETSAHDLEIHRLRLAATFMRYGMYLFLLEKQHQTEAEQVAVVRAAADEAAAAQKEADKAAALKAEAEAKAAKKQAQLEKKQAKKPLRK